MADEGRANGKGDAEVVEGEEHESELGCWRTAKTKVLFTANLAHCG